MTLYKIKLICLLLLLVSGCSKEVYLQPVPCNKPCFVGNVEDCPETKLQTQDQLYILEDVATPPTDYVYTPEKITRCKKNCRLVKNEK